MPTIPRIAYFAQKVTLTDSVTNTSSILPINSANIEVSRPIEAVTAFGKFNSLNTAQTNITTCKSTIKAYLGQGGGTLNSVDADLLNRLVAATQKGYITVDVDPAGYTMNGILTNIGIDISLGGFAMLDLGFAGVGSPDIDNDQNGATTVIQDSYSLQPVTTMSIGSDQGLENIFATSIKFSYDLPTDTLGALGENPNASQNQMRSIIATKAPYKSSITVEGYGIDISNTRLDSTVNKVFKIGTIGIQLPNGKVSARSINNAAGQVSATFSMTIEDVGAIFTPVTPSAYDQNFTQAGLPMYGG